MAFRCFFIAIVIASSSSANALQTESHAAAVLGDTSLQATDQSMTDTKADHSANANIEMTSEEEEDEGGTGKCHRFGNRRKCLRKGCKWQGGVCVEQGKDEVAGGR